MICVVTKSFSSTRPHKVGDLVDTTGWRHGDKLIEQRYMRRATEKEAASYKPTATASQPTAARVTRVSARSKPAAKKQTKAAAGIA